MDIGKSVLSNLEKITGIEANELEENPELDLIENGILDSLSVAILITNVSQELKIKIPIEKMDFDDFRTTPAIISGIEKVKE